jgi:hypothetical protein
MLLPGTPQRPRRHQPDITPLCLDPELHPTTRTAGRRGLSPPSNQQRLVAHHRCIYSLMLDAVPRSS